MSDSHALALPDDAIPLDTVALSADLATVITRVVVEYGVADPGTGLRPTVEAVDDELRVLLGGTTAPHRTQRATVQLAVEDDAQRYADALLADLGLAYAIPSVAVNLADLPAATIGDLLAVQEGDWLHTPTMPAGSPIADATARCLGVTEVLATDGWQLAFHQERTVHAAPGVVR